MVKKKLIICHLYPYSMNIYGDTGNVVALEYRLKQRGIATQRINCEAGEAIPSEVDIIVAGGGQDSGQLVVETDLRRRGKDLHRMIEDGVVMLAVCGTYQLLGHWFITVEQKQIEGIGLLDMETRGENERLIGNTIVESEMGRLVGFENHSGKTFLAEGVKPLGKVIKGAGNNGQTGEEGAQRLNLFGTYMHGPLLPKNPRFADELLKRALVRKYGSGELSALADIEEKAAAKIASMRPR